MKKINKILVVLGGTSKERKISLSTGKACIKAIKELKYKVKTFDPAKKHFSEINKLKADVIFNALHGKDGEDGHAQSYFEYYKIPYTHSGVLSSMNSMDKIISKEIFIKKNIITPKYFTLKKNQYNLPILKTLIKSKKIKFPIVVKPSNEGSSIGVKICLSFKNLKKETENLFKNYKTLLFEEFIGGQEIQVAVMNGKALGAIELIPKRKFYDYKAKYYKSAKTNHVMPANLNKKKYNEVLKIAAKAHNTLKCRGISRSDFKFLKNKFFLLETNTQPGMTALSLVPEIAKYNGISFKNLVNSIILDASIHR